MTIGAFIISLLPGVAIGLTWYLVLVLRAIRLRRLATAKLRVSELVTQMERLMLHSAITRGQVCHDFVHKKMMAVQASGDSSIRWNLLSRMSEEERELHRKLRAELESREGDLPAIVRNFLGWQWRLYMNRHPLRFVGFLVWVLFCFGGLRVLLSGMRGAHSILTGWRAFKGTVREIIFVRSEWETDSRRDLRRCGALS